MLIFLLAKQTGSNVPSATVEFKSVIPVIIDGVVISFIIGLSFILLLKLVLSKNNKDE